MGRRGAALLAGVLQRMAAGRAGEERVRNLLLDRLVPGMWVLNNLRLPGLGGDIDLLVIGPTGVFLPEVKTWSGAIQCGPDGHSWSRLVDRHGRTAGFGLPTAEPSSRNGNPANQD